jgi:hypothetical protein
MIGLLFVVADGLISTADADPTQSLLLLMNMSSLQLSPPHAC